MSLQQSHYGLRSGSPPQFGLRSRSPPRPGFRHPMTEIQRAATIRNEVNVKKATLRLEEDEENPGFHLVAFSFDATSAGSISIFFLARDIGQCGFTQLKPGLFKVTQVPFEKGLGQSFRQTPGTGVNLGMFDEGDFSREGADGVYPLIVRTETVPKDPPSDSSSHDEHGIGAPLPKWIHCQTTQAGIENKDGNFKVRVIRQTIWVDGTRYELQEIYGSESSGTSDGVDGNESAKDCVICMSEPRDTTVLPCRHMCMCSKCAKVLRLQTKNCPICQTPMERLLEMKWQE